MRRKKKLWTQSTPARWTREMLRAQEQGPPTTAPPPRTTKLGEEEGARGVEERRSGEE
jgi:hypothetical protein